LPAQIGRRFSVSPRGTFAYAPQMQSVAPTVPGFDRVAPRMLV